MRRRRWTDNYAWSFRLHLLMHRLNDLLHYLRCWLWEPEPTREEAIDRALVGLAQRDELRARRRALVLAGETEDCA